MMKPILFPEHEYGLAKRKTTKEVERIPYRKGTFSSTRMLVSTDNFRQHQTSEAEDLVSSSGFIKNFRKILFSESAENLLSKRLEEPHAQPPSTPPVKSELPALFGAYRKRFLELGFDPSIRAIGYDILVECCLQDKTDLKISVSIDKEILIYRQTNSGFHNITIDEDGDLSFVRLSRADDGPMTKMFFKEDGYSDETFKEIVTLL